MKAELTKEWCMNMAKIEARAVELHESCRMPMEQARELAASEAGPDWYARGQDWALADAMSGTLPNDWTSGDIARAFAAGAAFATEKANRVRSIVDAGPFQGMSEAFDAHMGAACWTDPAYAQDASMWAAAWKVAVTAARARNVAAMDQKQAEYEDLQRHGNNTAHNLARTQFALQRLADAADTLGVNHFGSDWLSDEVQELQAATRAARRALGPNVRAKRGARQGDSG
jgi:hypothetical protein